MAQTPSIVELARECLGTPFVHQGRICGTAMDCAGVLVHVLKRKKLSHKDPKGYPRRPYKGLLEKGLSEQPHLQEIPLSELSAGDVVLFRITTAPRHIGIYTGENVIHAYKEAGRVTEQSFKPWISQLKHVYRVVE